MRSARSKTPALSALILPSLLLLSAPGALWPEELGVLEWFVESASWSGNPFDVVAQVTFVHESGAESRTTEMFYVGENRWGFRFTGTRAGTWEFVSSSSDRDLAGLSGRVRVEASPDPGGGGFVSHSGGKWIRTGTGTAFVPQYVMSVGPQGYAADPGLIGQVVETFVVEHGFTGLQVPVWCRWFDIDEPRCDELGGDPSPDPRTFAVLESVIRAVYEAGGVTHLWAWGDDQRGWTPTFLPGGINGVVDRRLQRYIAARLGPLPGWTMGYGFDLQEWVTASQLESWRTYMSARMGWPHLLGGRAGGPHSGTDHSPYIDWNEGLDYSSYEHWEPDYDVYRAAMTAIPDQPVFSEDRFRIRQPPREKDYDMDETRRGLWHSTMAGGVANIWGNETGSGEGASEGLATSAPYPRPEQIKTWATFFDNRFANDLLPCNTLSNAYCLKTPGSDFYVLYRSATDSIDIDLRSMNVERPAIAVDTREAYLEIDLGVLLPVQHTLALPRSSDWAIAIGETPFAVVFSDDFESGTTDNWGN